MKSPVIVVFGRVPRLGVGKRRLARHAGDRAALRFSRGQLGALARELRALRGFQLVMALTPDHHTHHTTRGFSRIRQGRGDLGMRMSRVFQRYPHRPVVIIGSDIPGISVTDIRDAVRRLRGAHAVFGPAADGGYWLVGLSARRPARPFADVRWSSEHALADTVRNFPNRRIGLLRALADADTTIPHQTAPFLRSAFGFGYPTPHARLHRVEPGRPIKRAGFRRSCAIFPDGTDAKVQA